MTVIYDSYEDEPKDTFEPLTSDDYCAFYEYEMSLFTKDIPFFTKYLKPSEIVLELGVGSGRLASSLSKSGYNILGIDISLSMLKLARKKYNLKLACMDIKQLCFAKKFDHIFAPYNLLNILCEEVTINKCLEQCWYSLSSSGYLSADIFVVSEHSELSQNGKSFQFQVINYEGGKIIKEIVRQYISDQKIIEVEERYRLRPYNKNNKDYNNCFKIAAFSLAEWKNIFNAHNFQIVNQYGDYNFSPVNKNSSQLLITLRKQP